MENGGRNAWAKKGEEERTRKKTRVKKEMFERVINQYWLFLLIRDIVVSFIFKGNALLLSFPIALYLHTIITEILICSPFYYRHHVRLFLLF